MPIRHSPQTRDLEARLGRPLEDALVAALNQHLTVRAAAAALRVNYRSFHRWVQQAGVERVVTFRLPPAPTGRGRRGADAA